MMENEHINLRKKLKTFKFLGSLLTKNVNQIIKCLNQIISENKPYNLRLCTFTLHKFQENPGSG